MLGSLKRIRNRSATTERIINALKELLAQGDVDGVSISLLAHKADISKALIYRYFGGVAGLIEYYIRQGRTVSHYTVSLFEQRLLLAPTPLGSGQVLQLFRRVRALRAIRDVHKTRVKEKNSLVDAVILSKNIKTYFTEDIRKLISVKAVETMAGVPRNTILNLLTVGPVIPKRHLENIVNVLKVIGY